MPDFPPGASRDALHFLMDRFLLKSLLAHQRNRDSYGLVNGVRAFANSSAWVK
jgi:hypothetical protein